MKKYFTPMNDLTEAEIQIIFMIRKLGLFDKLEVVRPRQDQIKWHLTQSYVGTFKEFIDIENKV